LLNDFQYQPTDPPESEEQEDDLDDELPPPVLAPSSAPIPRKGARAAKPAKPVRTEFSYQLGAFVREKEVYVNAGIITMASFDYSSLCTEADNAAWKFTRQNGLELSERSSMAFLRSGKQTRFSKPLEDLEDWEELEKLMLSLLKDSTVKALRLDWELRWEAKAPAPPIDESEPNRQPLPQVIEDNGSVLYQGLTVHFSIPTDILQVQANILQGSNPTMRQLAELRANGTSSPAATQIVNQYHCSKSHCSNHQKHCFRVSSTHYPLSANDILL